MPRITVAIPSYNHEKHVSEAIQSVLNQTYQDFEIVITDDGSTDRTVEAIKTFHDPRIKLFCFEENRGGSRALNHCIQQSHGEYIAVLSSDDIFLPDKLEKQITFLETRQEIAAVFGYAKIIDDSGGDFTDADHFYYNIFKQRNRTRFEWLNHFFFHGNVLCHPSVLIRRKCYEEIGLYDERLAQLPDLDFWIRLCMKYEIHIIPEDVIKFRIRSLEANATGDRPETRKRTSFESIHVLRHYLDINRKVDFIKIFPTTAFYQNDFEESLIPFYLSMLSEAANTNHNFVINTLFNVLSDENTRKKILTQYGYSTANFIYGTGEYDLYNVEALRIKDSHLHASNAELHASNAELQAKKFELRSVYTSNAWTIGLACSKFLARLLPKKSKRRRVVSQIYHYLRSKYSGGTSNKRYAKWIEENESTHIESAIRNECEKFEYQPKISIVMPVWNADVRWLSMAIESVIHQVYPNWELCIADGDAASIEIKKNLDYYSKIDSRVKVVALEKNLGISGNTNAALLLATGEYVGFLDHDDELAQGALHEVVKLLQNNLRANLIFSDHDKLDKKGKRVDPYFKPAWSLPMLLSSNYVCHFLVIRKAVIDRVGGFREGFEGAQDYDLVLRIVNTINNDTIHHIPKILYHWRKTPQSSSSGRHAKPYAYISGEKTLKDYLLRNNIIGAVYQLKDVGTYQVKKNFCPMPAIDVVIMLERSNRKIKLHDQKKMKSIILNIKKIGITIYSPIDCKSDGVLTYQDFSEQLFLISKYSTSEYVVFVDLWKIVDSKSQFLFDWAENLIEHFDLFKVGVVGTSSPLFPNIIHTIHCTCGAIFCVSREILSKYIKVSYPPGDFDDLQIALCDYSCSLGYNNLSTPHSIIDHLPLKRVKKYYADARHHFFSSNNTAYYLPDTTPRT